MTLTELKAEIQTGPLAAELAPFVTSGNDSEIAKHLNAPRFTGTKSRIINARTILAEYPGGPVAAAAVLDKLDASMLSAVRWAMSFIQSDGIDIGHPATQGMLDQLAAGGLLTTGEASAIKQLGMALKSRAEVLGATIDIGQIATALRG